MGPPPGYEPQVREAARHIKGNLFIDVGANTGYYTIQLHRQFKRIYAIEPNPDVQAVLRKNLIRRGVRNAVLFRCALSDTDGEGEFFKEKEGGGSAQTILKVFEYRPGDRPDLTETWYGRSPFKVTTRRYDSLIKDEAELVKIDVEGAEFLVLEGAARALSNHRIRNLIIELHNRERQDELEELLKGYGYTVRELDRHPHIIATVQQKMARRDLGL